VKKVLYLVLVFIGSGLGMVFMKNRYHDQVTLVSHLTELIATFNWLLLVICFISAVMIVRLLPDIFSPPKTRKKEPIPQLLLCFTETKKTSKLKLVVNNVKTERQMNDEFKIDLQKVIERGKNILSDNEDMVYKSPYLKRVK
jgi:hypothetical protein